MRGDGGGRLGIGRTADAESHEVGRGALDRGQRVVLRQADHGQRAGRDFREGGVELDGTKRNVVPGQHCIGLHLNDAGEGAVERGGVARRIRCGERQRVRPDTQGDARQNEGAVGRGHGAQALAGQRHGGAALDLALHLHRGRAGLIECAVAGIRCRQAHLSEGWRRGVEREAQVGGCRTIARRIGCDHAQRVRPIGQRAAGEAVELRLAEGETAVRRECGAEVGVGGCVGCRVEGDQQPGHTDVVAGGALDARILGYAITGRRTGIADQGQAVDDGRYVVGRHDRGALHGEAGTAHIACGVRQAEAEVVGAQSQRNVGKREVALGVGSGLSRSQLDEHTGARLAHQRDAGSLGAQIAQRAGV